LPPVFEPFLALKFLDLLFFPSIFALHFCPLFFTLYFLSDEWEDELTENASSTDRVNWKYSRKSHLIYALTEAQIHHSMVRPKKNFNPESLSR